MATSSVRYWWLSKVDRPVYFAFNIGFVSSNCYELHSENKSQPNAISYPQKTNAVSYSQNAADPQKQKLQLFFEEKHTQLQEIGTHLKRHTAIVLCILFSIIRQISDFLRHDN